MLIMDKQTDGARLIGIYLNIFILYMPGKKKLYGYTLPQCNYVEKLERFVCPCVSYCTNDRVKYYGCEWGIKLFIFMSFSPCVKLLKYLGAWNFVSQKFYCCYFL
jgi:hypothetical protein